MGVARLSLGIYQDPLVQTDREYWPRHCYLEKKKRIAWPYLFSHVVVRLVVPVVVVGPLQERIISSMTVALMIISVFINILLYLPLLCLLPPCLLVLPP